jgi:phenylpropionate dioxygenase-like ring-hydroxylating dioxygenase large terminal subunit
MPFMRDAWYCAAWDHEVTRAPRARRLLDTPVLLFRKQDGEAVAIGDRCPHRFAPLSAGVVRGDQIQCPYHGLVFDASGACVANPHDGGKIPPRARVPAFPLIERQHVLWIWMGDPQQADPDRIVELEFLAGPDRPMLSGYIQMAVNYLLVTDNLLDLTHAPYLHGADIAPQTATRDAMFEAGEDWVLSTYVTRAAPTPGIQRPFFDANIGDHHTRMRWTAPGVLRQFLAMTEVGQAPEEGAVATNVHLLTPETENSTHYFWGSARNRRVGETTIDEKIRAMVTKAFVTEDEPMIAACRSYMGTNDLLELRPVVLPTDVAAIRARHILEKLIAQEAKFHAA